MARRRAQDDEEAGSGGNGRQLRRDDNQQRIGGLDPNSAEGKRLLALVERIERLEEDKRQVGEDISEVYAEAKGTGYDVKILRKVVSIRKQDSDKRREEAEILSLYLAAIGMEG